MCRTLKSSTIVEYNGVRISVKDLCAIFEMKLTTVLSRVNLLFWDLKAALTEPVKPGNTGKTAVKDAMKVRLYGVNYLIREVAARYDINESTLRDRIRRGMSMPAAALRKGRC